MSGSARIDAELGVLLQPARGLVDGEVLDLEVARRVARLDEVSDWPRLINNSLSLMRRPGLGVRGHRFAVAL